MRSELGLHWRGRAEGFVIQHSKILSHSGRRILGVDGACIPVRLCTGVLSVYISFDQTGIDSKAMTANKAFGNAAGDDSLKDHAEQMLSRNLPWRYFEKVA